MSENSTAMTLHESEETDKVIRQHACMAGGATLLFGVIPGTSLLDVASSIAILYGMYTRINTHMHVAFTKNKVQSIAKMVGANILGNLAGLVLARVGMAVLRFIPGVHLAAAVVDAGINASVIYICGIMYKNVIANLQGSGRTWTDEDVKGALRNAMADKSKIREYKKEAKQRLKGADYSAFKAAAKEMRESYENDPDLDKSAT